MAAKKGSAVRGIQVDFSGVESGGGRTVDDGSYVAEVTSVEEAESESGNPYLVWKWKITEKGSAKGAMIWDNTSLQPQALWRLKTLLEVLGMDVPNSAMVLDIKKIVGKTATLEITNEDYRGKAKPRVTGYAGINSDDTPTKAKEEPEEEEEEEEEGEKEEAPSPKKTGPKAKAKPATVEEDKDDEVQKFKKGQKVKFKDEDGDLYKGVVVSQDGDTVTVKVDEDEYEVEVEKLKAL